MRKTKTAGRGPPLDAQKRILPAGILSFSATLRITLQTLVVALGAGLGVWGVVNLLEGYGSDNPGSNAHVR